MTADEIREALRCDRPRCSCRRGRAVHCPAHDDRSPSFAVDERGGVVLVRCRAACRQNDLIAALRARGLWSPHATTAPRSGAESPLVIARRRVLYEARRQPWAQDAVQHLYALSDWIRFSRRRVAALRNDAATMDWDTALIPLVRAARLETLVNAIEAELDEVLAEGRIA